MENLTSEIQIKSCSKASSCTSCGSKGSYDWLADIETPIGTTPYDIVQVKFKGTRTEYFRNTLSYEVYLNDYVVVELENGQDIGRISMKGEMARLKVNAAHLPPEYQFRKIIRQANEADMQRYKECKDLEVPTQYRARTIALELGLTMKLSDVEYQADKRKAIFYYTAEERVDFRELIKKLADEFKIRIEMKQIGYRQEAGRLGGIGSCGRDLCCNTWLSDFKLVHTNAARYQNLSLNQLKLSGQCGKLKCCLNFELDAYQEALKEFPEQDHIHLEFAENAKYRSVKTDILKRLIWFMPTNEIGGEWISLSVTEVKDFIRLNKENVFPELPQPVKKQEAKENVELDFTNDVGLGSLTRLDEKGKNRNKNRNNQRFDRNNRNNEGKPRSFNSNNQKPFSKENKAEGGDANGDTNNTNNENKQRNFNNNRPNVARENLNNSTAESGDANPDNQRRNFPNKKKKFRPKGPNNQNNPTKDV